MEKDIVANLDALIAGLKASSPHRIWLDHGLVAKCGAEMVRPVELVGRIEHFVALGVVASPHGLPCMREADGCRLHPYQTLARLFGTVGGLPAVTILDADYGRGPWDEQLIGWFDVPPCPRDLALARLQFARALVLGQCAGKAPPAVAPRGLKAVLGLRLVPPPGRCHLANVRALSGAVASIPDVELLRLPGDAPKAAQTLVGLVLRLPHFVSLGVVSDAAGAPRLRRADGQALPVWLTLDCLFGTPGGNHAGKALFRECGAGCWDHDLMDSFRTRPTCKQLILARLYCAEQMLSSRDTRYGPDTSGAARAALLHTD